MDNQIALIAGEGSLPVVIASRLTDNGNPPAVYSIRESIGELSKYALDVINITKPDFGFTIKDMKKRGVRSIIMAGTVSKTLVFKPSLFDLTTQRFLAGLLFRDDHSILGAIVDFLEKEGFKVLSYRDIVPDLLAKSGHIAGRAPTRDELDDSEYGFSICKAVVPLSFGQTVIVNKRSVVAVEAMEGTDATLLRAGSLCKGGTVAKMMRLDQDERYDIPTVGPDTLRHMAQRVGADGGNVVTFVLVEAHHLRDRAAFAERARAQQRSVRALHRLHGDDRAFIDDHRLPEGKRHHSLAYRKTVFRIVKLVPGRRAPRDMSALREQIGNDVAVTKHLEALFFEKIYDRPEDRMIIAEKQPGEKALRGEVEERRLEDERLRDRSRHDDAPYAAFLHVLYRKAEIGLSNIYNVKRVLRQLADTLPDRIDGGRIAVIRQPACYHNGKRSLAGDESYLVIQNYSS